MLQIYESLKALITPELSKAAGLLGEQTDKVSNASSGILSGILAKLFYKGNNPLTESVLREAGKSDLLGNLPALFSGSASADHESIATKLQHALLGDKTGDFTSAVAKESGISHNSASKLTGIISAVTAGFLGNKLHNGSLKMSDIIAELGHEKNRFMGLVPAGIKNLLGVNGKYSEQPEPKKKKKGMGWLLWLLLAIVLLLLIVFGWRSCKNKTVGDTVNSAVVATEQAAHSVSNAADNAAQSVKNAVNEAINTLKEFTLPNGLKFQAYTNGMEDKMIAFLNSDAYKNAKTDADLSSRWFEFEDVDFPRDKVTGLDEKAQARLSNITAILKAYPNAKIRIAGNADKSGNRIYNAEISKERADAVKAILVKNGIAANRIVTEGFGDEQASWPADASASQSASDRDIAFRFTK